MHFVDLDTYPILQLLHWIEFAKEFEVYPSTLPVKSWEAATVHAGYGDHRIKILPVDGTCSVSSKEIEKDLDYREPNKKTMKDAYPLPWPDEVQDRLAG